MYPLNKFISAVLGLTLISSVSYAGVPPITVRLQNKAPIVVVKGEMLNLFYLVGLNSAVPQPGLNRLGVSNLPIGFSQISQVSNNTYPCGDYIPVCTKPSFSLSPGSTCCLAIQVDARGFEPGTKLVQPVVGTLPTPSTYSGTPTEPLMMMVRLVANAITVGNYQQLLNLQSFYRPFSYSTTGNDNNWALSDTITPPADAQFVYLNNVSCDSNGINCATVGNYRDLGGFLNPIAYYSSNGGVDWIAAEVCSNLNPLHLFYGVSCSDSGNCVAVGNDNNTFLPYSYVSADFGKTWSVAGTMNANSDTGFYMQSIACDSTNATNCTAVGFYRDTTIVAPTAFYTTDGGNDWTRIDPTTVSTSFNAYLNGVSCDDKGQYCVAVGAYATMSGTPAFSPLSYYINLNTPTWSIAVYPPPTSSSQILNAVACDSTGTNCVAVGHSGPDSYTYFTTNGGAGWTKSPVSPIASTVSARLSGVDCDRSGQNCVAVGFWYGVGVGPSRVISYYTLNGGMSWTFGNTIFGLAPQLTSTNNYLNGVSALKRD